MATIDASKTYMFTNAYTQSPKALAAITGSSSVVMQGTAADVPKNQQWFLSATSLPPFYRLHTVAGGADLALDILNDSGTGSTGLRMTGTGTATGQYWRFDSWDGGSDFRLSNNYTGLDMHLDVYSDTLEPHLAPGDLSGQHWTLTEVRAASSTTTAAVTHTSSSTSPTGTATEAPLPGSPHLSAGAIAGIAGGGAAILVFIGLIVFILRRRMRRRGRTTCYYELPSRVRLAHHGAAEEKETESRIAELASPPPKYPAQTHYFGRAELGAGDYQAFPAELPASTRSELADTGRRR